MMISIFFYKFDIILLTHFLIWVDDFQLQSKDLIWEWKKGRVYRKRGFSSKEMIDIFYQIEEILFYS